MQRHGPVARLVVARAFAAPRVDRSGGQPIEQPATVVDLGQAGVDARELCSQLLAGGKQPLAMTIEFYALSVGGS